MTDPITIPNEPPKDSPLSYDFLRKEGMNLIQQMSGDRWTDHNTHDPGITILEQLCYAITDLAYRADYDIKELLGKDGSSSFEVLYSAATILTTNPVTLLDLRKMVMDVSGVKNAWVEKVTQAATSTSQQDTSVFKGLYQVFIEKDALFGDSGTQIVANVKAKLQACRGVCEDFETIKMLDTQPITLQGTIAIVDTIDNVNQLMADVLHRIATHLSPRIPFYTLQQLLEQGKRTDEIFEGPPLQHGFIDDQELLRHHRKQEIQASDIIRALMDVKGVLTIDTLSMATGANTVKDWILPLDPNKTPTLDLEGTLAQLSITSQGLAVSTDTAIVINLYNLKMAEGLHRILPLGERDLRMSETADRHIASYYAIQNQFPANYGIGDNGLPDTASKTRKAQAKQLTAYLTFFEQVLANYFSQVANFKKLMSFDGEDTSTYFNQSLLGSVAGLEELLRSKEDYQEYLKETTADSTEGLKRKNKFLNHLLARFGEKFTGYGMLLQDISGDEVFAADKKLIKDKATFLKEYPSLSAGRAKGYDYTKDYWQNDNISGLEKRIARKLGIEDYTRRNLGDGDTEGFHMIEHILLRPRERYPYPFTASYNSSEITSFEAAENEASTRCMAANHDLKEGERLQIMENEKYKGIYTVVTTGADYFEIAAPFQELGAGGNWQRTPDIRYFIRSSAITNFSKGSQSDRTFCTSEKPNVQLGDHIEITATINYNGTHEVVDVNEEGFEIRTQFNKQKILDFGRWMPIAAPKDPYSLQLTFVLPEWVARYQNTAFKQFVIHTIREETPAHITAHIKWLTKKEMQDFDKGLHAFLGSINTP